MAIGYLIIQARTAHDAVPLANVQIRILDDEGRNVYELTTGADGETPMVSLETVAKGLSLDSYYAGEPYVSYGVLARRAGFDSVHVSGIPIYEGETAVLPVTLIPMQSMQRAPETTEIVIGRPAAAMRQGRYQEEPVAEPRILRQVVIPEPITVHLGAPASYAANVQVSFPDYVKNVASSEIYPTWPEASLRANIYAIITFALNRVFTEWYRSRGYDFDITNSTAYDQYFVYGRPIYESINRVVDDIFNEYVRRRGQNAPYFTSFCNGTTTTCAGLSQWGTVTLAQRGLTPIQILRTYYPDDIEIVETDAVTGILSSYPGTPLRVGSTGLNVQTVQTYLNRIRNNYPAIPAITDETGVFGNSTRAAVIKFQSIFGLGADGIVGKATWYKLSEVYAAVTRLAELDSEGTTLGIGTVPPTSILRMGSRGADVLTLQYLLSQISEYYPTVPGVTQDGIFGTGTQQAVIAFQRAAQLTADGIVGPSTWQALYQSYLGIENNVPGAGGSGGSGVMEYTVRSGDTLWLLAQRFGTTVDAIKRLNGLTGNLLNIGQVLKIPTGSNPSYFEYTVRSGDTLWLLAQRYGTTVDAIKSLNGLSGNLLNIGQVLLIPTAS
ncbi:MAG: LysM peptidoglycan-binding domain-containing protein [Bacillus sp. (in: Bacteria)]|nr:LysM peptidoglycan-binding domain-containing protein [Bacillus sp. (in: firmicutes)]